jgi:hypothetical protein
MATSKGPPFTRASLPWIIIPVVTILTVTMTLSRLEIYQEKCAWEEESEGCGGSQGGLERGVEMTEMPVSKTFRGGKGDKGKKVKKEGVKGEDRVSKEWATGKRGTCVVKLPSPDEYELDDKEDLGKPRL